MRSELMRAVNSKLPIMNDFFHVLRHAWSVCFKFGADRSRLVRIRANPTLTWRRENGTPALPRRRSGFS